MKNNKHGFTLIEMLITVGIIGILAAVTYPSYRSSLAKSRRADAQGALVSFANAMSQWYLENDSSYCGAEVGGLLTGCSTSNAALTPRIFAATVPTSGGTPTYNLTIGAMTDNTFTLRATPTGTQAGDGYLELNELGVKSWDKNDNGYIDDASEASWN